MERDQLQEKILKLYRDEHAALGEAGGLRQLEQARQWDLAPLLRAGGVVVFPHAGVADCGHQIAAAVNAALDSGADTVLVVSVLHAFTEELEQGQRPRSDELALLLGSGDATTRPRRQSAARDRALPLPGRRQAPGAAWH